VAQVGLQLWGKSLASLYLVEAGGARSFLQRPCSATCGDRQHGQLGGDKDSAMGSIRLIAVLN
jgi:hypothetical protein